MHVLMTGAAGMIGRKLTERLVKDGKLNGKPVDRLTLIDVVPPEKPQGFSAQSKPPPATYQRRALRPKLSAASPT